MSIFIITGCIASCVIGQLNVAPIHQSGQPLPPGFPANSRFGALSTVGINAPGEVAMWSVVGVSGNLTISTWSWVPDDLRLLMRASDPAPGFPAGSTVGNPTFRGITDAGNSYFYSIIVPTPPPRSAIFRATHSDPVALSLGTGSVLPDRTVAGADLTAVHPSGLVLAYVSDSNGVGSQGIGSGDTYSTIFEYGHPAPGIGGGTITDATERYSPMRLNGAGQVGLHVRLSGPSITNDTDQAIYRATPGAGLELVAQEGVRLPGIPVGWNFRNPVWNGRAAHLDSAGNVTFMGDIGRVGLPLDDTIADAVWTGQAGDSGNLRVVMQTGEAVSGHTGLTWNSGPWDADLCVNGPGTIAFAAVTRNADSTVNPRSLWLDQGGTLTEVFSMGGTLPGAPAGAVGLDSVGWGWGLGTNNDLLIHGALTGGPFGTGRGDAMWYRAPDGNVSLVLIEGGTLEVSPGVFKTIAGFDSTLMYDDNSGARGYGVGDGSLAAFTDTGYFVFRAEFTDGTYGVYRGQVPAPGVLVIPALALAAATRRRRGVPSSL